ncbi:nucleotide-diphospho-sugar transferase [Coprinopsis marcescibilis]|uniref:Nucleotide-diphospho-sugar transferase n=1 Tax=Coprinopsis marcescibilis TaxID=230819 RepID=A0A5C3LJ64_COPMA|nr:nucleotide-diphospho-sugar transferase [Coprinopsis marcescibilis]
MMSFRLDRRLAIPLALLLIISSTTLLYLNRPLWFDLSIPNSTTSQPETQIQLPVVPVPIPIPFPVSPPEPHPPPPPTKPNPFAFVFYATNPGYACSALLLIRQLASLSPGIPTVLMAPPDLNQTYLDPFTAYNTTILRIEPPQLHEGGNDYYTSVLLKLMAFGLHQRLPHLQRIVVLDSDQTIRKPLDNLFTLPTTDIAAPIAYWLHPDQKITSTLLVISLSDRLWNEVEQGMKDIRKDEYDMDLVNRLFYPRRVMVLPGSYCTLNSHWEAKDLPVWMQRNETGLQGLWDDEAVVVHFTAVGKPWGVNLPSSRVSKKNAHPRLLGMIQEWVDEARRACTAGWRY